MAAWVSGLGSNDPNRARRHRGRSMGRGRRCYPEEYNSKAVVLCLDKDLGQGNWVGGNGRSPNKEEGNSVYRRLPTIDTKTNAPRATLLLLPHYPYGGKLVPKPSTAGKNRLYVHNATTLGGRSSRAKTRLSLAQLNPPERCLSQWRRAEKRKSTK